MSSPRGHHRDRPGADRGTEQLTQRGRSAVFGQELPDIQIDDDRGDPWPVLHRRVNAHRRRTARAHAAGALPFDELVLFHPYRNRRDVKLLPTPHTHPRGTSQTSPAPPTSGRLMDHHLIGHCDGTQRGTRMPLLATRFTAATPPQRARCGFGQPFRRGRLGRIPGVLSQPRLKLSHPLRQPSILRPQLLNHPTLSGHQREQLLTRQPIHIGHTPTRSHSTTPVTHRHAPDQQLGPNQLRVEMLTPPGNSPRVSAATSETSSRIANA
jgi:hypothetical protein